jgi:hypothetical protein
LRSAIASNSPGDAGGAGAGVGTGAGVGAGAGAGIGAGVGVGTDPVGTIATPPLQTMSLMRNWAGTPVALVRLALNPNITLPRAGIVLLYDRFVTAIDDPVCVCEPFQD